MNEVLKNLAGTAQAMAEYVTPQGLEWFSIFKQKFAELMIEEFLDIAENELHPQAYAQILAKVQQHFEIK